MPESDLRAYTESAWQYAEDVVKGRIIAGTYVRQQCQLSLDMRETANNGIRFDDNKAAKPCLFLETMPHIKGKWARSRERIHLQPWQRFGIATPFGFVNEDGNRVIRTVYDEIARKNGKSCILSGVGNYLLALDGEHGAEIYSAATTRDQARIVFAAAKEMAKRSPEFQAEFGVAINAHRLVHGETASFFEALSAEANSLDGLNPHAALVDELHAHRTRMVYDVLEDAMGAREQPFLWIITTAGGDLAGICYEVRGYLLKVLERTIIDPSWFGLVYTLDEDDDWADEDVWIKANPNLDVSVSREDMRRLCQKAIETPSARANFKTKKLNIWVQSMSQWIDMARWHRCATDELDIADFAGRRCYIGLDLATRVDMVAKVLFFPPTEDDPFFSLFGRYYLPEDVAQESSNSQYRGWVEMGRVITCDGDWIDNALIEDDLERDLEEFDAELAIDPWQASSLIQSLQAKEGVLKPEDSRILAFRQTVANMSEPMKEFEVLVRQGALRHDGDPVLAWMMSNCVAKLDAKDNIYPRKERVENKIDGVVATIMAMGRYLAPREVGPALVIPENYEFPSA